MTPSSSRPRVLIALNTAWNLVNFRAGLIRSLVAQGYEVIAVAPRDGHADRLAALGARYVELPMDNGGTNPVQDLRLWWRFRRVFKAERPDVYLGYTVKPNVYGSLAAHSLGIPVVNNIAGLGAVFIRQSVVTRIVRWLYRTALRRSAHVFFQNDDDRQLFVQGGLVREEITSLIPGSGIDLSRFAPVPDRGTPGEAMCFLLIARMLWDKGVQEYVDAARALRQRYPQMRFAMLGFLDVENPAAIPRDKVEAWVAEGVVEYWGTSDDVRQEVEQADCVVLPSYREGTPRTLLEAAAMGKPLVTTDAVGCREVVDDGVNGYLCEVRSATSLANAMERLAGLGVAERAAMGQAGRDKMTRQFDERIVVKAYLTVIDSLTRRQTTA
ncbi:MAG: glycosyltransferase family 4 protein [Hydrogenophaga sp.]|nr:glycosyltransferase family 4 protein [Hydrogenophaga sp.]